MSSLRWQILYDLTIENQQADIIAAARRHVPDGERSVDSVIEFRQMLYARGHQTSGIDHDYDALIPFHLKLLGNQVASPGRRRPRDVANLVSAHVIAQTLEFPPLPAQTGLPVPGEQLAATLRGDFVTPRFID